MSRSSCPTTPKGEIELAYCACFKGLHYLGGVKIAEIDTTYRSFLFRSDHPTCLPAHRHYLRIERQFHPHAATLFSHGRSRHVEYLRDGLCWRGWFPSLRSQRPFASERRRLSGHLKTAKYQYYSRRGSSIFVNWPIASDSICDRSERD